MRVLVIGSGGREHALAWKIARSPRVSAVFAAPGSDGMAREARALSAIRPTDVAALLRSVREHGIDLVVVGPEDPLAAGVSDRLREAGVAVFGPSQAAAQLESSKAFAKAFMARHRIPTAGFALFDALEPALAHARARDGRCVVKADGLAAGKGVAVCSSVEQAERALRECMGERRFGEAGARVVIEDVLTGEECSYYAITDGERIVSLAAAQDHKRALDGDEGENTGGMGAVSPAAVLTPAIERRVLDEVVRPVIRGMTADGHPYTGVLYAGLMIDAQGTPNVVEFNVRFGDPETQPLMLRLQSDLVPLLDGAARGRLDAAVAVDWADAAVCVVMASGGYPRDYRTGLPIDGLEDAERDSNVVVFHAGTKRGLDGRFVTAGGRVLGVTARGESVAAAREHAYAAVDRIRFEGAHVRRDIAWRALAR